MNKKDRLYQSRILLDDVKGDAKLKYLSREQLKTDTWRDMHPSQLMAILRGEYDELLNSFWDYKDSYEECLDVINVTSMVAARIKEYKAELKKKNE